MISTTVQHAMRAMAQLSRLPDGECVLGRDIAERADVPVSYLSKILGSLGRSGLVEATRGMHGGYRLARPASEITLRQIVESLEPDTLEPVCFLKGKRPCSNQNACPIHQQFLAVRQSFEAFLANSTLEDLEPHNPDARNREVVP